MGHREHSFSLSGGGTKRIPISRPQVVAANDEIFLIFRDLERGGGISMVKMSDPSYHKQKMIELYSPSVEMWEPTLDRQAWKKKKILYLFVQKVGQGDQETLQAMDPQRISVLKWKY